MREKVFNVWAASFIVELGSVTVFAGPMTWILVFILQWVRGKGFFPVEMVAR